MSSLTPRLGLTLPSDPEPQDIDTLNTDYTKIDAAVGVILVNAGVTPPNSQLFDGAVVKEKTTGKIWVAQKNAGTGNYDKTYIRYPYSAVFYGGMGALASSGGNAVLTLNTWAGGLNSSLADLNTNAFVAPITGIYRGLALVDYAGNATGRRGLDLWAPTYTQGNQYQQFIPALPATYDTALQLPFDGMSMTAGDRLSVMGSQNSGAGLATTVYLYVSLENTL